MGKDRLSGLTVMNMNHGMEVDLETVCQMFIESNKRNMFSHTVSIINVTQIRCANIITMEKATSTGA